MRLSQMQNPSSESSKLGNCHYGVSSSIPSGVTGLTAEGRAVKKGSAGRSAPSAQDTRRLLFQLPVQCPERLVRE